MNGKEKPYHGSTLDFTPERGKREIAKDEVV